MLQGTISVATWLALGTAIATIVLAVATIALALSTQRSARDSTAQLALSAEQLAETGKAAQLAASVDLLREYRLDRLRKARVTIREIPAHAPGRRLADLTYDQREAAIAISHYLDNLGALVVHKLLTPDAARTFLGSSVVQMWEILGPYIYAEREAIGFSIYQIHFEHLAWQMSQTDIEARLLAELDGQLMPPPT
jgi:hypothetical protein